jgi:hypothetical protein
LWLFAAGRGELWLTSDGRVLSTNGTFATVESDFDDIMKLRNGTHVLAVSSINSSNLTLADLTGVGGDLGTHAIDTSVTLGDLSGSRQVDKTVFDRELINPGNDLIGSGSGDRMIIENTASGVDTFAAFVQGQDKVVIVSSGFQTSTVRRQPS